MNSSQPSWGMTDVVGMLGLYDEFKELPFRFDTDVNAPAVAEFNLTQTSTSVAASSSTAYVTVGTGIGVGLVVNNLSVKGLLHPEAGHIQVGEFLIAIVDFCIQVLWHVSMCVCVGEEISR